MPCKEVEWGGGVGEWGGGVGEWGGGVGEWGGGVLKIFIVWQEIVD